MISFVMCSADPYPREESAIGIAFNDGQIKKWTDAMSPSFRNIIKNVLISSGHLKSSDKVETMRKQIAKLKLMDPPDWFEYTMKQNVLWLNTALTFSGTDKSELNKHTKFWAPIVEGIVETLLKESTKGIVFVLWGGNAKKLKVGFRIIIIIEPINVNSSCHKSMINKVAKKETKKVEFVEANHPAVESFNDVQTFTKVNEALKKLDHEEIDWLGTEKKRKEAPSSSSSVEDEEVAESSNKKAKK